MIQQGDHYFYAKSLAHKFTKRWSKIFPKNIYSDLSHYRLQEKQLSCLEKSGVKEHLIAS